MIRNEIIRLWCGASSYLSVFGLTRFLRPYRGRLALFLLTKVAGMLAAMLMPLFTRFLIDNVLVSKNWSLFAGVVMAIGIILLFSLAIALYTSYLTTQLEQGIAFDLRRMLQRKWESLSISFFKRRGFGEHIYRMTTDVDNVTNVLLNVFPSLVMIHLEFLVFFLIAAHLHFHLTVYFVASLPALLLIEVFHSRSTRPIQQKIQVISSNINNSIGQYAAGVFTTKVFLREKLQSRRYVAQLAERIREVMRKWRQDSFYQSLSWLASSGWGWVIIFYGFALVLRGELTLGTLVALKMYLVSLMRPIENLGAVIKMLVVGSVSAERLTETFSLQDQDEDVQLMQSAKTLWHPREEAASLALESVHFGYSERYPLFKGLTVRFNPTTLTGITGPSGAGKTTLVALVARLYEPWQGRICLDGADIREMSIKHLRSEISIVLQETFLFHGTLWENIAYGQPNASLSEIIQAAQMADAHEFISSLGMGYETIVGGSGIDLSLGQKQRIGIARAFLKQSRLLILDEGMNSLDTCSRQKIFESLRKLARKRTIILVTHDPSTLMQCDSVAILVNGQILQQDSCESLYPEGGFFQYLRLKSRYETLYNT